jgi:hypothetical protein
MAPSTAWFEEKSPRGLGRNLLVVWGETFSWFGEKPPRGLERKNMIEHVDIKMINSLRL